MRPKLNSIQYTTTPTKKLRSSGSQTILNKSFSLSASMKLDCRASIQGKEMRSRLIKLNSLNTQTPEVQTQQSINYLDKFRKDPIYREKIKLMLAKNETLLTRESKAVEYSSNPEKIKTLKQMIKHENSKKLKKIKTILTALTQEQKS